jgi:hypothetical protein
VFGLSVLMVLTAACGSSSEDTAPAEEADSAATSPWASLPLSGLVVRTPEEQLVRLAREESASEIAEAERCMAEAGFPGVTVSFGRPVLMALARPRDLAEAKARGLNRTRALAELQDGGAANLDPEESPNSDMATAKAAMEHSEKCDPNAESDNRLISLQDSYRVDVLADPRISAARRSWSECMAAEGFPTDSVSQLANSIPPPEDQQTRASMTDQEKESFDAELLAQEIPAAEAVVRCDEQELFPVLPELAELEQSWMDEHAQELRQLRETDRILWGAYVDL